MPKNADPYLSIQTEPATVKLNKYGLIRVRCGNAGNDSIVANSMRIVISAGLNARITSIIANSHWKKKSLSADKGGNTIILTNKEGFKSFDMLDVMVRIRGVKVGKAATIIWLTPADFPKQTLIQ